MTTQEILQGVHDWTNGKIVYDISVAHPDGQGNPTKYADLTAALGTGGANIPEALRKGGMSVKFVLSSDNKYVQYRFLGATTDGFTNVANWQGVDEELTAYSSNLIESGGVAKHIHSFTLVGNDSSSSIYRLTTQAGHTYRLLTKDWLSTNIGNNYKLIVGYTDNGTTQYYKRLLNNEVVSNGFIFNSVSDNVFIGYRANQDVQTNFVLEDITIQDVQDITLNTNSPVYIKDNVLHWQNMSIFDSVNKKRTYLVSEIPAQTLARHTLSIPSGIVYLYISELDLYKDAALLQVSLMDNYNPDGNIVLGVVNQVYGFNWINKPINLLLNKYKLDFNQFETIKQIDVTLEYGRIAELNGVFTECLAQNGTSNNVVYPNRTYIRTPKFIKLTGAPFSIVSSQTLYFTAIFYDSSFVYLGNTNYKEIQANTEFQFIPGLGGLPSACIIPFNASYMKLCFRSSNNTSSLTQLPIFRVSVIGDFDDNPELYNTPSIDISDYGAYQTLAILVDSCVPTSTDTITNNVQDSYNYLYDYGVLALPLQYSNVGEPTRLIIYCHGAGASYNINSKRFSTSIDARLWLSEGYAVLDIGGNPFNENAENYDDTHGFVPAARCSYIAAYEWVTKNYNICKDGILLAGKSMGGGMTFDLLNSNIPIIASCAIVPVCNYTLWWNYMTAARRQFVAEHLGFVGTPPTWTNNNPMTTEEWQYFSDNYDKWVLYNPFTRTMCNPPLKNDILKNMRISSATLTPTNDETELWNDRIAKAKAPVKIFVGNDDTIMPPLRNGKILYDALLKGSSIVEYRQFATGGHYIENVARTEGHKTNWTNTYGVQLTNVPVVFVEILQFWRRYEQLT